MADNDIRGDVVAADKPIVLSDDGPWMASRGVVVDKVDGNIVHLTLERQMPDGSWVMDTEATGDGSLVLQTPLSKKGTYRWITRSKTPVDARHADFTDDALASLVAELKTI